MTKEREEMLLSDVGYIKGNFDRFLQEWDDLKPSLATKKEVADVDARIDRHEGSHVSKGSLGVAWAGVAVAIAAIAASFWR